jgi:hypothetical protein
MALAVLGSGGACGDDEGTSTSTSSSTSTSTTATTGGEGAMGGGGATSCGPAPGQPSTAECKACTSASCCAQAQACTDDPLCLELALCLETCGDDADCAIGVCQPIIANVPPPPTFLDLQICQLESCDAACNPGPFCEILFNLPDAGPDCLPCQEMNCCDEAQAAFNVDWLEFLKCQSLCLDAVCLHDCETRHSVAVTTQNALLECVVGPTCGPACEGGPYCGLVGFTEGACSDCATQSCCDPFAQCSQSVECVDYFNCWINCMTPEACTECAALWGPEVAGQLLAGTNCLDNQCNDECGGFPQGCGLADGLETFECADCQRQNCCAQASACGEDATCAALKICASLCDGDTACEDGCDAQFPAAVAAHEALLACKAASCAADCP